MITPNSSKVILLVWLVVGFLKEFGVHGFPLVCLMLDLSLNVYQFPKRHLWIVIIFGFAYLFLNIGTIAMT